MTITIFKAKILKGFNLNGGCVKSLFTAEIRRNGAIRQLSDAEVFICILMLCGSQRFPSAVLSG